MKILTGYLSGQKILFKPNPHLRPTADKVRKAIFDALQGRAQGARILDLFSGTGALGFEALSQEAKHVTFVEWDKNQAKAIQANLERLGLSDRGTVICDDALRVVQKMAGHRQFFDLVFLDPPYGGGWADKTLRLLSDREVTWSHSLMIVECDAKETLTDPIGIFHKAKNRLYGGTQVAFFVYNNTDPASDKSK